MKGSYQLELEWLASRSGKSSQSDTRTNWLNCWGIIKAVLANLDKELSRILDVKIETDENSSIKMRYRTLTFNLQGGRMDIRITERSIVRARNMGMSTDSAWILGIWTTSPNPILLPLIDDMLGFLRRWFKQVTFLPPVCEPNIGKWL